MTALPLDVDGRMGEQELTQRYWPSGRRDLVLAMLGLERDELAVLGQ